jgi:hypothetical protein
VADKPNERGVAVARLNTSCVDHVYSRACMCACAEKLLLECTVTPDPLRSWTGSTSSSNGSLVPTALLPLPASVPRSRLTVGSPPAPATARRPTATSPRPGRAERPPPRITEDAGQGPPPRSFASPFRFSSAQKP